MFYLDQPLIDIPGIGPKSAEACAKKQLHTVKDFLLWVPLRYEDRTKLYQIADIQLQLPSADPKQFWTVQVTVNSAQQIYRKGKTMQRATVSDETGKLNCTWFNNKFILQKVKKDKTLLFSGQVKQMGKQLFMTQPIVEEMSADTTHTNRLVPIYSIIPEMKPTMVKKMLKSICDDLDELPDLPKDTFPISLTETLKQLHFPDDEEKVIQARERLAIEELIALIRLSHRVKEQWKRDKNAIPIIHTSINEEEIKTLIPDTVPFSLTHAQERSLMEIVNDLSDQQPMNRLLIGDVGSGKTIVAGIAMQKTVKAGYHACLIAPTQVLAEQHAKTLAKFFPDVDIELITGNMKSKRRETLKNISKPSFIIGTHAVLNWIHKRVDSPLPAIGLIVYDEQHRFGVKQRSVVQDLNPHPHILTMTATPIPRSLMLTIFSHLSISVIDELPANRIPTKTWLVEQQKKQSMLEWVGKQMQAGKQVNGQTGERSKQLTDQPTTDQPTPNFLTLYVCPFIDPSDSEALENVASVKQKFEELTHYFQSTLNHKPITLNLLHGRQKKTEQAEIIEKLYNGEIDLLVTTPIVEVGIDLPQASAIIIDSAERFGMASLHQLRGRVGRAGQQGYCLLLTQSKGEETKERLDLFTKTLSGQELAEYDLQRRGAGDLFGTQQHGFDQLRFAQWTDFNIIHKAKLLVDQIDHKKVSYISLFEGSIEQNHIPLAN